MKKITKLLSLLLFTGSLIAQNPGGKALNFRYSEDDNPTRYINCGNDASLNPGASFTAEVWMRVTDSNWNQKMFGKVKNDFKSGYVLAVEFGKVYGEIWTPDLNEVKLGLIPPLKYWVHVALTFDSQAGKISVYINGELVDQVDAENAPIASNDEPFIIGLAPWDLSSLQYFGEMDEIRAWSVARSEADIKANMFTALTGNEDGLMGYWDFNEATEDDIPDASPNRNDGTATGFVGDEFVNSFAVMGNAKMGEMKNVQGIWTGKAFSNPRFATTEDGMSVTGDFENEDTNFVVFGHNELTGATTDDIPSDADAAFKRSSRLFYANAVGDNYMNVIMDAEHIAGGGDQISTQSDAGLYTLLHRSGESGEFKVLAVGNKKSGNKITFEDVKIRNGYYALGSGEKALTPVSIKQNSKRLIANVFPNPSNGDFYLNVNTSGNYNVEIYSAVGQLVYNKTLTGNNANNLVFLDLNSLNKGIYRLRVDTKEGSVIRSIVIN